MRKKQAILVDFCLFSHEGDYIFSYQFIYMLSGQMEFEIGRERMILNEGDALYFDPKNIHKTRVLGRNTVEFLSVFIQDTPRQ